MAVMSKIFFIIFFILSLTIPAFSSDHASLPFEGASYKESIGHDVSSTAIGEDVTTKRMGNPSHQKDVLTIAMHHHMPPLTFLDREDRPVGLLVDFWRLWSQKTGKKIQFLPSSWVDTLNHLKTGKADIHAGLYFSDRRSNWMAFSQSFYESDASLFYPIHSTPVPGRMDFFDGKRVGAVSKTFHEAYLKKNYPGLIVVPYRTTGDMIDAIENQKIDAFFAVPYLASRLLTTMGLTGNYKRMDERHGRQKFRAGILKENKKLMTTVDRGFEQISHDELVNIEKRWIPNPDERVFNPQKKEIRMTYLEEAWIREHPIWPLIVTLHQKPYILKNEDNTLSGILFDYLEILSQRLNVVFKPVFIPQKEVKDAVKNMRFNLLVGKEMPEEYPDIHFSEKLYSISHVIINRVGTPFIDDADTLQGQTVSAVRNSVVFDHIQSIFPDIHVFPVSTELDALLSTSTEDSDAAICDLKIAAYLIADQQLPHLKIAAPFQAPEVSIRFGVANDLTALSLLNKAIQSISRETHQAIDGKWNPIRYEKKIDWKIVRRWVSGVTALFLFILGVILLWNRRLSLEVTERKKAQAALKDSEERYRGIIEFTKSGVMVFKVVDGGENFVFSEFNQSAERIENIHKKTLMGKRVSDVFPGFKAIGLMDLFLQVHQTGIPQALPTCHYQDSRISGWRQYFVYRLPTGEIAAFYSDETQHIADEEEKEKLTDQLHQAQKMETIGTLAGGIAHDFNNTLSIIMGFIELALSDKNNPESVSTKLSRALEGCNRAKDIISQLLRLSRQTNEEKQPIRMNHFLMDSLKLIRSMLPATIDIQTKIAPHEDGTLVMVDTTQMYQLLLNLSSNAAHAMKAGGRLTIRLIRVHLESDLERAGAFGKLSSGPYFQLVIEDTGTGIKAEILDRIFDPYFTTKEIGKGTGMGLSIVAAVVRAHHGSISVDSEPGRGTTFNILLPICKGTEQTVATEPSTRRSSRNARILLVDDEEMILDVEKDMLEKIGYRVTTKANPIEALDLFRRKPDHFDLLITDMTMPGMTGNHLIKAVLEIRPKMPIVICSGFSDQISRDKAQRIGATCYMDKPLSYDQLAWTVNDVLDQTE